MRDPVLFRSVDISWFSTCEFLRQEQFFLLTRMRQPFATAKKGVRMIPTRSHLFAAKKVARQQISK